MAGAAPGADPADHAQGPPHRQVALPARVPAPLQHTRTLPRALPRGTLKSGQYHNNAYFGMPGKVVKNLTMSC